MTMTITGKPGIGGDRLSTVPSPWTGRQKAEIVAALRDGRISDEEACDTYGLTPEEIAVWQRTLDSLGLRDGRRLKSSGD